MATSGSFNTSGYNGGGYPDHYTFSWSLISQSISENYSDISYKVVGAGGSSSGSWTNVKQKYVTVNGSTQSNSDITQTKNGTVAFSGTARIYHNADGTKSFSASCGGAFYYYGSYNSTGSSSWDLPTIPRQANITNASNFTDEQNPTINYSNQAGNSVSSLQACISLTGATDNISYRDISKTGNSYTFNLSESERNVLRNACKNSKSLSVIFFVKTVIGGNTFYSTLTRTMTITNGNPIFTLSNISYQDTNTNITAITGNNKHIVRNLSNLKVTVSSGTARKGASISKYELTFNGITKTLTSAGTVDFGTVNLGSNSSVSVKIIDSRGNSTTASLSIIILDWQLPTASITAKRVNNYEDETKLTVQVSISSVNSKNSIQSLKYRYKKSIESNYSDYKTISNNETKTIVIDKLYVWDFQIEIKDKFGTKIYNFQVAKGMPIMMIDVDLISVGINCFPTKENSFEVNGYDFNNLHPINSIIITTNNNNPSSFVTGTWELLSTQSLNNGTIYYWKRVS